MSHCMIGRMSDRTGYIRNNMFKSCLNEEEKQYLLCDCQALQVHRLPCLAKRVLINEISLLRILEIC